MSNCTRQGFEGVSVMWLVISVRPWQVAKMMDPTHAVGAAWAPSQVEVPVKGPLLDYAEVVSEAVACVSNPEVGPSGLSAWSVS
jgi:hypothetical protein